MMTLRIRMFLMRRHSGLLDFFKSDSKSFCFLFEDFVEHDIVSTCRAPNLLTAEARRTARFSLAAAKGCRVGGKRRIERHDCQ
jgi:hypothetical protein